MRQYNFSSDPIKLWEWFDDILTASSYPGPWETGRRLGFHSGTEQYIIHLPSYYAE